MGIVCRENGVKLLSEPVINHFFGFRIQNGRNNTDFGIISRFSMPSYILLNVGGNDSSNEIFVVKFVIYTKFRLKKHQSLKIFFIYLTLLIILSQRGHSHN